MAMDRPHPPSIRKMTRREREAYEQVLHAISLMRRHSKSIHEAAREAGTTPSAIRRWAASALRLVNGREEASPQDQLEREMLFYDRYGRYSITVGSSTAASQIGEYHNAVKGFLTSGDDSKLRTFSGNYVVDIDGRLHYFLTDPAAIRQLARAGVFGFDSIY